MDWLTILDRFGVATLVLVAGGFGLWRVCKWFASKIAEPLIGAHLDVISTTQKTSTINSETLQIQTGLLKQITSIQEEQNSQLKRIHELLSRAAPDVTESPDATRS